MKNILFLLSIAAFSWACESRTYEEISDQTPAPVVVKYTSDVQPLVDANCLSCHSANGSASYFPLTEYSQVKNSINNIIDRIQRANGDPQKMPQGGSLSTSQINIFVKWKADGLLEN